MITPHVIESEGLELTGRRLIRTVDTEESYRLVLVELAIYGNERELPH